MYNNRNSSICEYKNDDIAFHMNVMMLFQLNMETCTFNDYNM